MKPQIRTRSRWIALAISLASATPLLAAPPAQFNSSLTSGATTVAVNYALHPIRGANFQVLMQDSAGNLNPVAAPEARTYIGTVNGYPGASACALLQPDGTVWEYVVFEAGDQWWATNGTVTSTYGSKTFTPAWPTSPVVTPEQAAVVGHVVAGDVIADIPYNNFTNTHGGSVDHAVYVTEFCLMQTNLIYLRDLGFLHRTGRIVIRGNQSTDPYQSGDPLQTLRGQFGPFTGHEAVKFVAVPGYGGGAALLGTIGDWYSGASVNDTDGKGDAFIYWRHEVGHNHGAGDGQGGYCENYTLLNANQVGRLSGPEEAAMINSRLNGYYYNESVLEDLGGYTVNLPPRASLDTVYAQPGLPVRIDVLANDHDSNGNAFSLLSFDATSVKGASIYRSVGTGPGGRDQLIYVGGTAFPSGLDSFQYRIQDSNGGQALGNVFVKVSAGDLCAYWPMDETSGTVVPNDAATPDGTLYNGASWVAGTINNALSFNGVNQYVTGAVKVPLTDTAVSMWFRTSQSGGGLYSATTQDGSGHDRHIYLNGGNINARIWNEETISSTGKNYADNQWHQVVHTFGGVAGGQKLYVDGELVASGGKSSSDFNWQTHVQIGYSIQSPTRFFNGQLDDLRIWNRALTAAEALALAQRSGTANYPNPPFASIIGGMDLKLDWLAPTGATSHDIYLNDRTDIVNSTPASDDFMGNFTTKPLDVEDITPGHYYWRVDEHRDSAVFKGPVWSFQYLGTNGSGTLSLPIPTSWWVNASESFVQSGPINGSGTFYKDGPGTLILTANNTNTGGVVIRDGVLQVGDGGTTGWFGSGPITVYSTLAFNRSDNVTFSGILNGPGNVIQYGPGGLTLSGSGITYTGNTILNGGSLTIAGTPNFNSAIQINAGQLIFDSTSNYIVAPKVISGTGPVTINGNNANWTHFTADNTYTGGTLINAGGMLLLGKNTPAGSVLGDITNNGTLGLYHSNAWTFSNNVSGGGTLNLYSPSGNSVTVSGNTISLANLNAFQNPGGILTNTTVNLSGSLNLSTNSTLTIGSGANVTVTGGMTQGGNTYNGTMSTLKVTGGNLTFGQQINDGWDGAYTVTQTGGTVTAPGITGGNGGGTWSNDTYNLQSGTLILGANGINGPYYKWPWFPSGGGLTMNLNFGGGTLGASANWSTSWPVNLTGTNGNLTVAPDGRTITLNGVISGPGGINLTGSGNLILAGNNTYAGGTTIGAGTTLHLGNNSAAGSLTGDIVNNGTLNLYRNNAWTFSNNVSGGGAMNLFSPGGNPVTISGNTLALSNLSANQNPGAVLTNTTVNLSGALNLASNSTLTIGSGAIVTVAGGMTQLGNAYNHTMSTLKVDGGSITFGGLINDGWDGAYKIHQTGGTVTAPGITGGNGGGTWPVNTYILDGGTLVVGANGIYGPHYKWPWFPYGGGLTMNLNFGGGTLSASANWTSGWGINLTGTNGSLTVNPAGHVITVIGPVTGSGGITLTGSGSLILAATNSYSGSTTIGAGNTFGGAGGMSGPVTCNGTLAPGNNGPGNLAVNNTLTLAPDSAVNWQVSDWFGAPGTGYDRITTSQLELTATPDDPVIVRISAQALTHFSEAEKVFPLIESTGSIAATWDPAKFVLDASAFTAGQGTWSIRRTGDTIELVYGNYTDTDGDGTPDWQESGYYHTDPNVANTITSSHYATIPPHDYLSATGHWSRDDSGSLTALERRGKISFPLTVAAGDSGIFEIALTGGAAGAPRPSEYLPLVFFIDDERFGTAALPSIYGGSATATVITPWLTPGNHTLTVLHDNYRGDIQLRIDALEVRKLTGLEQRLDSENQLTRIPASSLTSPVCIEGVTSHLSNLALTAAGNPISASESVDSSFFADVPLSESSATTLNASFQSGEVVETHNITWTATNLFQHGTLDIRKGDSLRIDAWTGGTPSGTFTVTLDGTLLTDNQSNTTHTSGQPFAATFNTSGTHTLVATLSDNSTHTVTLKVHSASFGPAFSVRCGYYRDWIPASLSSTDVIQPDSRLAWQEIASNPRRFRVTPHEAVNRHVLSRLSESVTGAPGAILARGTVNAFYLASIDETADPSVVTTYPDGTVLMSGSFVAVNLPPDIRIKLTTLYQGTVFTNGSNTLWLSADDFDQNGVATVYYERAGGGGGYMCTYVDLYVMPPESP